MIEMIDIGLIIVGRVCIFLRLDFYDKIFFGYNIELLFVKEVIFVFGCCKNFRGKIFRFVFIFKKYKKLKSKIFFLK